MVGNLGVSRTVRGPKPGTLDDALSLVTAFGNGDGELASLLRELRAASAHNERVRNEAEAAVERAEKRLAAVEDLERREREVEAFRAKARRVREEIEATLAEWQRNG